MFTRKLATVLISSLVFGFVSIQAHAEGSVGNGGNAVVCKDSSGKITSVELLDYYEARTELGFKIDLGDASLDPAAKAKIALDRFGKVSPILAKWLNYKASVFIGGNADFIADATLTPVSDSNQVAVPSGCAVIQLAIQKQVSLPSQKTYTINKDLWDLLDNDNKAGLILHEITYTEALNAGAQDSVGVRYFNGMISSHTIETIDLNDLLAVERQMPLKYFEYQGHEFVISANYPYFSAHSGAFIGGPVTFNSPVVINGGRYDVNAIFFDEWGTYVEKVVLANPENFDFHGFPLTFTGSLMLDKNGKIRRGKVSVDSYFDFESPGYSLKSSHVSSGPGMLDYPSYVAEDENGNITECGNCEGWVNLMGQKIGVVRSGNSTDETYNFFNPDTMADPYDPTLHVTDQMTLNVLGNPIIVKGQVKFYDQGKGNFVLESGDLVSVSPFQAGAQSMTLYSTFSLYPSGNVALGVLAADTSLTDEAGNTQVYPRATIVQFDEKGLLVSATQQH